jgi:YVTN family beta-propeller protein
MHRRPSAVVLSQDETKLFVANQRSGTLSTVDLKSGVVSERPVGQQLTALVRRPGSMELLTVDQAAAEVIVFEESSTASGLTLRRRIETAGWPVSAAVSQRGTHCCVASLWSRQVTLFPVAGNAASEPPTLVDLPFAARAVAFLDEQHAVVADAFGGRIAIIDCDARELLSVRELPLHNIRSLIRDRDHLLLTHQVLNPAARTEAEHIHWGVLMENEVSLIPIADLLNPAADLARVRRAVSIGGPGNGAGDPQALAGLRHRLLVSLGGRNELALIDRVGVRETRVPTGLRPVSVTINRNATTAFVVNQLSDSVSVIDLVTNELIDEILLGPSPTAGLAERGERAFFDASLSLEGWMSCHSCHTDGHTNNRLADTLGDGGYGDAKRIPSLLGVWATGPWAWNGKHLTLHSQVKASLLTTMHTPERTLRMKSDNVEPVDQQSDRPKGISASFREDSRDVVAAELAAYLTTLSRPPAVVAARGNEPHPAEVERGAHVFETVGCSACHDPFTSLTTEGAFDVGLMDREGNRRFNPPSLGGLSQRDRLLHDGRARSPREVLNQFKHPNSQQLPEEALEALAAYLESL